MNVTFFMPTIRLPGSMFALDIEGGTVEDTGLGFNDGDADRPCLPIPGTLVPVPWQTNLAQVQLRMFDHDGSRFFGWQRQAGFGQVNGLRHPTRAQPASYLCRCRVEMLKRLDPVCVVLALSGALGPRIASRSRRSARSPSRSAWPTSRASRTATRPESQSGSA